MAPLMGCETGRAMPGSGLSGQQQVRQERTP